MEYFLFVILFIIVGLVFVYSNRGNTATPPPPAPTPANPPRGGGEISE